MAVFDLFSIVSGEQTYHVRYSDITDAVHVYNDAHEEVAGPGDVQHENVGAQFLAGGKTFVGIAAYPYAEKVAPEGTFIRTQCYGFDLYNIVADGRGGERQGELIEANNVSCGYVPKVACVATFPFVIEARRGPRYILELEELDSSVHRFEWLEKGYTGEPEYLCGSGAPARITWEGTGNKYDVLHGSGCDVTLTIQDNDNLLRSFFTADERKYQLNHYRNGVLFWSGYHLADIYNTPWDKNTFHASIQAYDGLASLGNRPYLSPAGLRYYGRARSIDVVFRCLRLLDLDLPVWLGVNVLEDRMNPEVEPLSQSWVDQAGYYDEEDKPLTCKQVLERVLQPYNAFIRQAAGAWHILRYNEVQGPYKRRRATIGRSESEARIDEEVQEHEELFEIRIDSGVEYREAVQALYAKPAFKQVTTVTEYGAYENFVQNGRFETWAGGVPLLWKLQEGIAVEKILGDDKFEAGFPSIPPLGGIVGYLESDAYGLEVQSAKGFTVSFDYAIIIEDFIQKPGLEWIVLPEFTANVNPGDTSKATFSITNVGTLRSVADFNGTEVAYDSGNGTPIKVKSDIPVPGIGRKRCDTVYATAAGALVYALGQETDLIANDLVVPEPDDALLVTYVTWEGDKPHFSSTSSQLKLQFQVLAEVGGRRMYVASKTNRGNTLTSEDDPELKSNKARWTNLDRTLSYYVKDLHSEDGYTYVKGTFTLHSDALALPGIPRLRIYNPLITRSTQHGVQVTIDNVFFGETAGSVERMYITGENEGHINTGPFELEMHHGSGIPRTQALVTLADGTPTQFWNSGKLLQENTARDLLAQHSRALLVLTATLTKGFTPVALLKDPHLPNRRFFVDKYAYEVRSGMIRVDAIEVLGGVDELPPVDALITEDGRPMVSQDFKWIVKN